MILKYVISYQLNVGHPGENNHRQGDKAWDAFTAAGLIVASERAGGDLVLTGRWL